MQCGSSMGKYKIIINYIENLIILTNNVSSRRFIKIKNITTLCGGCRLCLNDCQNTTDESVYWLHWMSLQFRFSQQGESSSLTRGRKLNPKTTLPYNHVRHLQEHEKAELKCDMASTRAVFDCQHVLYFHLKLNIITYSQI